MSNCIRPMMTRTVLAACLTAVLPTASPCPAQERDRPAPVASEAYRPSAFPDRMILTFADDPARAMAVTWRTDATVTRAQAQIARADHGPQFESSAASLPATSVALQSAEEAPGPVQRADREGPGHAGAASPGARRETEGQGRRRDPRGRPTLMSPTRPDYRAFRACQPCTPGS